MIAIRSTSNNHPELQSYCWVRFGRKWTLQPVISHERSKESAFAVVLETKTDRCWCICHGSPPRRCADFDLAIEQAEAATADFLRGDA